MIGGIAGGFTEFKITSPLTSETSKLYVTPTYKKNPINAIKPVTYNINRDYGYQKANKEQKATALANFQFDQLNTYKINGQVNPTTLSYQPGSLFNALI